MRFGGDVVEGCIERHGRDAERAWSGPALAVPPEHLHHVGVPGRLEPSQRRAGALACERIAVPCLVHGDAAAAGLVERLDALPHGVAGRHG